MGTFSGRYREQATPSQRPDGTFDELADKTNCTDPFAMYLPALLATPMLSHYLLRKSKRSICSKKSPSIPIRIMYKCQRHKTGTLIARRVYTTLLDSPIVMI
jgi:hypothetical protein